MRRALVTGGNRGIGRSIAEGLIAAGLEVTIGARDAEMGVAVADEIGAAFLFLDLGPPFCLNAGDLEGFDVVVNNAGVCFDAPLFSQAAKFEETMTVMVTAAYEIMRATVPAMGRRGYGRVVNVSSGWGSFAEGLGGPGAYGIAKASLNALTLAASRAAGPGVLINAVCPGWVRTRMGGSSATISVEDGADTAIWLATLPEGGPTGQLFRQRREIDW